MKRLLLSASLGVGIFLWWVILTPHSVSAAVGFEQQINIINQEYSNTGSAVPSDNSLGLIRWDGSKYTGETVYLEAMVKCDTCSGGNDRVTVALYTAGGSAVTNGSVSTTSETYTRVRTSTDMLSNLSNGTDYTVRITRDADSGTAYIKAARLIVIQSASTVTDSQTQIELGGNTTTANTAYEVLSVPKVFHYDAKSYAPTPSVVLHATLKSTNSGTAYAALSTATDCSSTVSNSEASVTSTSWTLDPSDAITLTDNTDYYLCIKASSGETTSIANAKLVLTQSTSAGIAVLETHAIMVNRYMTDSDSTYTSLDFPIQYAYGNYTDAKFYYFFESFFNTSADTGYVQLYNVDDTAAISNSAVDTTNTGYTRKRSVDITAGMPTATKILDTQAKNSSTSTTALGSSSLIIRMHAYPSLTFTVASVNSGVSTNGVTTTVASSTNELDLGYLIPSTPAYIAHQLSVTTNTATGYNVTMKMVNTLQGEYPANIIEEFPATWGSPQAWTEPTGTTPNVNTGWIGANTSDTRVAGWSGGSGKFGPVGTTSRKVMEGTGPDGGTNAYVTYAIEVNSYQPTDTYAGTIIYSVVPTY